MTRGRKAAVTAAAVLVLAGCSGGSSGPDVSVCVDALDEADAGFTAFSQEVRQVQAALDQAFAGDLRSANSTLAEITPPSPSRYKQLEQQCRDAAG